MGAPMGSESVGDVVAANVSGVAVQGNRHTILSRPTGPLIRYMRNDCCTFGYEIVVKGEVITLQRNASARHVESKQNTSTSVSQRSLRHSLSPR